LQLTHTPRPDWDAIMDSCPELRRKVHKRIFDALSNYHKGEDTASTASTNHGKSAFTSLVMNAKKHDDLVTATAGATSPTDTEDAHLSTSLNVHNSTELLTNDLVELIECHRKNNVEIMELEGTLRELGVVELKKILTDTKRHIIETERMINDVKQTSESISTSNTHKALVGGDKHTILEGQYFTGVGNHPQVPRYLRWSGQVRKRGIQKGELWALTDRVWKSRIKQRKKYDDYMKEENSNTSPSSNKRIINNGRVVKKKSKPKKPEDKFSDFFYNWLFQRHKSHQLVVEWGYNIMAGLEIYMWDAHLELFLLCLTGAVTEGNLSLFS
jgi:hypothetical protein